MSEETTQAGNEQTLNAEELREKYLREIEQSKSYRKRAQTAEERLAALEAEAEERRQKLLEEKGEFDTVKTELQQKLEAAESKAAAWEEYQAGRREALVAKLADDKLREIADALPLDKLEAFVDLHAGKQPPPENRPAGRSGTPSKPFNQMSKEEQAAYLAAANAEFSG